MTEISGVISGASAALTVNNNGSLWLAGVNTYGGATTIAASTVLSIINLGSLGNGSYAGAIANSGTFTYASSAAQTLSGTFSSISGTFNVNGAGTLTLSGAADNNSLGATVNNGGKLVLGKTSTGSVHALGGVTTVNSRGTLQLGGSGGDQIYDGVALTVASGGLFDLNGQNDTITSLSLSGIGISSGGALINNNGSTTSTLTCSSGITLAVASSIGGSANLTLPSTISGAFNLIKTGAGKVTLSAASGRTTTAGTTQIDSGVLRMQSGTALNTLATAVTTINGGILELNGSITLNQPITFNSGATLRSDGNNINNGKVTVSGTASASVTFATVSSSDTFTIGNGANDVSGGSSTSTIHIAGPGTTLLTQSSDYTGNWSVDAGTLLLQSSVADLGATSTATLTLNGGGLKLNYAALQTFVAGPGNNVAVTAVSTMTSDRTASTANGLTYTFGNLSINGSQLNIVGGANVTGGSNPAGITFGATTLTGSPTFNISNPTAGGSTLLTLGAVNNGANTVTLKGNGKFAQSGVWGAGAGGLTLDATYTGTATLSQANTYTGATTVNGGILALGAGGSIGASATTVSSGATLANATTTTCGIGAATALSSGALASFTGVGGGSSAVGKTSVAGNLTLNNNAITVNVTGSALATGSYRLLDCTGTLTGSANATPTITGTALASGYTATVSTTAGAGGHVDLIVKATPVYSGLTGSQSITYGTASVTLGGSLSATGPIYPPNGETVTVTINGNAQTTTINDSTGDFSINYNLSGLVYSPAPYTISYFYAGDATFNSANDTSKTLTVNAPTAPGITSNPTPQTACNGSNATFTVAASGGSDSYAWYKHTNAGWGSTWTTSGDGGTFLQTSAQNNNGAGNCNSFSSSGDINTPGGNSWGLYGGGSESVARMFPAALTSGQVFQVDMDNGGVDSGVQNGFSLQTSGGTFLLSFYFLGGGSDYVYFDTSAHTTTVGFTRTGLRVTVIVGEGIPATYSLQVTPCGGSTVDYMGTFAAAGAPGKVVLFNNNTSGDDANNLYFNSMFAGSAYDNADNYSGNWGGSDKGDTTPISGATSTSYTTSTGSSGDQYYAIAYNGAGYAASTSALLTVNTLPTASVNSATICAGGSVTLNVMTSASSPSYLWSPGGAMTASIMVSPASTTTYTVTVTDGTTSCANSGSGTVTVNAVPSAPTAGNDNPVYGSTLHLTASTVSGATYAWTGPNGFSSSDQNPTIASVTMAATGEYSVTATVNSCTSSAGTTTVTVNQASTTNSVTESPNPSLPGSNVTFTATLAAVAPGAGTPTGTVLFKTNGVALCDPITLDGGGVATLITNSLPHGSNALTAEYAGDSNFLGSSNSVVQVVNTPPTNSNITAGAIENANLVLSVAKLLRTARDADTGDTLSVTAAGPTSTNGPASNVVLDTGAGTITYTPATDYVGSDSFTYTISDNFGGTVTPTVFVTVISANVPSPNIVVPPAYDSGSGTFSVTFAGIPGYSYTVQTATSPTGPWSFLKTATAGTDGLFVVTDTESSPPPARYYRTVYP